MRAVLPVPSRWDPSLLDRLRAALDGSGPALLPVPEGAPGRSLMAAARPEAGTEDDVALLLPTSGSTGTPKVVELAAGALQAGAAATAQRLGGHGTWLLPLPLTHVAGWQVLVRSAVAGTVPVILADGPFTATRFAAAAQRLPTAGPRFTSLVPTQLSRLLDDADGVAALRSFRAVLLGGAAASPRLLERAADQGARVVATYGMTETSGGCVYDGLPLDGVRVRLDAGRVLLSGPVLARGYRGDPDLTARTFEVDADGARWFRTSDTGTVREGRLTVLGRLDDVLLSGGANVHPAAVERVVAGLDGVEAVVVVGVPDPQWGEAVVAVVCGAAVPDEATVRTAVSTALGREHAPRHVVVVDAVPLHGIGKPDRRAAQLLARQHLAR